MNERRGGTGWIRGLGEGVMWAAPFVAAFGDLGIAADPNRPILPLTANGPALILVLSVATGIVGIIVCEIGKRAEFGFLEG